MSHDEERGKRARILNKADRATRHWINLLGGMVILILLPMDNGSGRWVNLNDKISATSLHSATQQRDVTEW